MARPIRIPDVSEKPKRGQAWDWCKNYFVVGENVTVHWTAANLRFFGKVTGHKRNHVEPDAPNPELSARIQGRHRCGFTLEELMPENSKTVDGSRSDAEQAKERPSGERDVHVPAELLVSPFVCDVAAELARAEAKHRPMNSLHEAYAVILEEVDELWDECRKKSQERNLGDVRTELVQIAAMAWRAARNLDLENVPYRG